MKIKSEIIYTDTIYYYKKPVPAIYIVFFQRMTRWKKFKYFRERL